MAAARVCATRKSIVPRCRDDRAPLLAGTAPARAVEVADDIDPGTVPRETAANCASLLMSMN
jgi:hypothetical protein